MNHKARKSNRYREGHIYTNKKSPLSLSDNGLSEKVLLKKFKQSFHSRYP